MHEIIDAKPVEARSERDCRVLLATAKLTELLDSYEIWAELDEKAVQALEDGYTVMIRGWSEA